MASVNKLLGSGVEKIIADDISGYKPFAKHMYHKDFPLGKDFDTVEEQEEAKENGWVESPADLNRRQDDEDEIEEGGFESKPPESEDSILDDLDNITFDSL